MYKGEKQSEFYYGDFVQDRFSKYALDLLWGPNYHIHTPYQTLFQISVLNNLFQIVFRTYLITYASHQCQNWMNLRPIFEPVTNVTSMWHSHHCAASPYPCLSPHCISWSFWLKKFWCIEVCYLDSWDVSVLNSLCPFPRALPFSWYLKNSLKSRNNLLLLLSGVSWWLLMIQSIVYIRVYSFFIACSSPLALLEQNLEIHLVLISSFDLSFSWLLVS